MMRTPFCAVALVAAFVSISISNANADAAPPPLAPAQAPQPAPGQAPSPPAPETPEQAPPEQAPVQSFEDQPVTADPNDVQPDQTPVDVQAFAAATLDATPLRFAFNAFGDVSLSADAPDAGDESATFSVGTFALLINAELSKTLLGTAEVEFDAGEDNQQEVTLERLHLRWQTPRFFVVGGRTHSDLGYWNTAFHHGAWLHLPIGRPRVLRGEDSGGLLPIHSIGVEAGFDQAV